MKHEDPILKVFKITWFLTGALFLVLAACGLWLYVRSAEDRSSIESLVNNNRNTLCAFRDGLQEDYNRTQIYIEAVKSGDRKPIPNTTLNDFRQTQKSRIRRLEEFKNLSCKGD